MIVYAVHRGHVRLTQGCRQHLRIDATCHIATDYRDIRPSIILSKQMHTAAMMVEAARTEPARWLRWSTRAWPKHEPGCRQVRGLLVHWYQSVRRRRYLLARRAAVRGP